MQPLQPSTGLAEKVIEALRPHPLALAYLFGSHARGTADSESDLDIAVLADASISKEERFALKLRLTRSLAESLELPVDRLDLVMLQDVPSLLQYNVIRTGQPIFARTSSIRHDFELDVERRYEDESPYLDREAAITFDRILSRRA